MSLWLTLTTLAALAAQEPTLEWLERPVPQPDDYPAIARDLRIDGYAEVFCQVNAQGIPINCRAGTARPAHMGFENAAVRLVQKARLKIDATEAPRDFSIKVPFNSRSASEISHYDGPAPNEAQMAASQQRATAMMRNTRALKFRIATAWNVDRMPDDMRQHVMGWLDELAPPLAQERQSVAMGAARVLAIRGLQQFPATQPADWETWRRDILRFQPLKAEPMLAELRQRYCATYDCTSGETPDTP